MSAKVGKRVKKSVFDPNLAILGGPASNKYVSQAHLEAAKKVALHNLTRRIREPVNAAGVGRIHDKETIYGVFHTEICKPVTLATLRSRMGIAATIAPWLRQPRTKITPSDLQRARKLAEMHAEVLNSPNGPFDLP